MHIRDLRLVSQVLLLDKVCIVKVRVYLFLELLWHREELVLLQVHADHTVVGALLEDVLEAGSLVGDVLLDFDLLGQAIHVLEGVFWLLSADELLELPNVLLLCAQHAFTLVGATLVLVSQIDLVFLVHLAHK